MFLARSQAEINSARSAIERVGRLSDNVFRLGPLKIGLDGVLAWIPGIGTLYSTGAAILLIVLGWRARVPLTALAQVIALLSLRTAAATIGEALFAVLPISVPTELAVDFFRAHKWSADILLKAIDNTLYVEGSGDPSNPGYAEVQARVRSGDERRRVVFLR